MAQAKAFNVPDKLKKIGIGIVIGIVIMLFAYKSVTTYIAPNEFGIKEVKIGFKRGIHEEIYDPGINFVMPFGMERIHRFPRDLQVLEMTMLPTSQRRYLPGYHYDNAAHIQTSDGHYVDVDVSILYRINDPYQVMTKIGPGPMYITNGILPKAEPILKDALGVLTTEQFYNSPLRTEKVEKSREMLNTELESKGLHVEQVLIRYFAYSKEIQSQIEEKKLKDQLVFKNEAEERAAKEGAVLIKIKEEGEATLRVKRQEGLAYKTKKNAEKELYVRKRTAEGDLLVKLADARKTELRNEALQKAGSDRMVALELADAYKGMEIIVLPTDGENGINPLDMDGMMELFGVK